MTIPVKISSLTQLKTITTNKINSAIDKEVTFNCPDCDAPKFITVPPDGSITCPDCGFGPDLSTKAKAVTLSLGSRLELINELFQLGEDVSEYYVDTFERYADGIDAVHARTLSATVLHKVFAKEFKPLQEVTDWLLAGRSETPIECKVYSDAGLLRKQSGGDITEVSLSKASADSDEEPDKTPMETVEALSLNKGYSYPFYDKGYERVEFLSCVSDPLDKKIISLISQGCNKTDVSRILGLTTQKLETRLKHIGEAIQHGPKPKSNITKICKSCGEAKSIDDFGKDTRRKDGLQGICLACDAKRKKKYTGIPLKIAC